MGGAVGRIRSERVSRQRTNLVRRSFIGGVQSSPPSGFWLSVRVRRYSRGFPALAKLFNAWLQSLPVSSLYPHSTFNLFPYTAAQLSVVVSLISV